MSSTRSGRTESFLPSTTTPVRTEQTSLMSTHRESSASSRRSPLCAWCTAVLALLSALALATLWGILSWDVYDQRYGDQFEDGDYNVLVALGLIGIYFCLLPAQTWCVESVGIQWRGPLGLRGAQRHSQHIFALLLPPLLLTLGFSVLRAKDIGADATTGESVAARLMIPGAALAAVAWTTLPTPLLRADRCSIIRTVFECVVCLCGWSWFAVTFRATFVADVFTSLPTVLVHLANGACFYIVELSPDLVKKACHSHGDELPLARDVFEPLLLAAPFAVRFVQCTTTFARNALPACTADSRRGQNSSSSKSHHVRTPPLPPPRSKLRWAFIAPLVNSAKYASALLVIATATMRHRYGSAWTWAWVIAVATKTIFCFAWDVAQDWGLVSCRMCDDGDQGDGDDDGDGDRDGAVAVDRSDKGGDGDAGVDASARVGASAPTDAGANADADVDDDRQPRRHRQPPCITFHIWDDDRKLHPLIYLAAIVVNLAARLSWAIAVGPYQIASLNLRHVLWVVEICRRLLWSVIRIEHAALSLTSVAEEETSEYRRLNKVVVVMADKGGATGVETFSPTGGGGIQ